MNIYFDSTLTGKISNKKIAKDVNKALNKGLLEVATIEGQGVVQRQLYPGHGQRTGELRRRIGAALVAPLTAQFDAGRNRYGENIWYGKWVEGIDPKNTRSRFKGYHMFQNAVDRLDRSVMIFQKHIRKHLMRVFL